MAVFQSQLPHILNLTLYFCQHFWRLLANSCLSQRPVPACDFQYNYEIQEGTVTNGIQRESSSLLVTEQETIRDISLKHTCTSWME